MGKLFMVVLVALISLPVFADEKKPTPTAVAKRQGQVKPTPAPADAASINGSRSNTFRQGQVEPTPAPAEGAVKGSKSNSLRLTGRVLSQQGKTFTVMSNGKEITFSGAKLKALPKVGDDIDINYTQTPNGPLEAVTVKSSKSNSSA